MCLLVSLHVGSLPPSYFVLDLIDRSLIELIVWARVASQGAPAAHLSSRLLPGLPLQACPTSSHSYIGAEHSNAGSHICLQDLYPVSQLENTLSYLVWKQCKTRLGEPICFLFTYRQGLMGSEISMLTRLTDLPVSAPWMLGLKACTTTHEKHFFFKEGLRVAHWVSILTTKPGKWNCISQKAEGKNWLQQKVASWRPHVHIGIGIHVRAHTKKQIG